MAASDGALRLLIAGGGTGGHVMPALAVAEQLRDEAPESAVRFVGAEGGLEARLVPQHGFQIDLLRVGKLKGAAWLARARTLAGLAPAVARAAGIVRRFAPDVIVGVGGYASAPVALAARFTGRPMVLLEQNAIPGFTNRVLSRLAERVVVSFAETGRYFPRPERTVYLGNPVRPALLAALRARAAAADAAAATRRDSTTLLVVGGSQGARRINELVCEIAPELLAKRPRLRLVHQCGETDAPWVRERHAAHGAAERVRVHAFIDDMVAAYLGADVLLGRAGATTIAEISVAGLPALLVPYPYAADDHQSANARALVDAGAAQMVRQDALDGARLLEALAALIDDDARR
ncbi:MAG: undecaprenyldiphospho-muramoylpentapeptide beta-N-acetylglucosaminyltransferase, partial [Myxococcales bacterium]|nr:undecaprenyldiphospho-muramoylpentapeptide beta-N-acetylglucosaminyltransferase [Myxococcales bacterium]